MYFKFKYRVAGTHTHINVYASQDKSNYALCGELHMRNEEWIDFEDQMRHGACTGSEDYGGAFDSCFFEEYAK